MTLIEEIRKDVISHSLTRSSVTEGWQSRRDFFRSKFVDPESPTRLELINLGSHLSEAFGLGDHGERNNEKLSTAGYLWAAIVSWYFNICYAGTHAIAFPGGKSAPQALKDAMSITYQNDSLRSDSDILILSLPDLEKEKSCGSSNLNHLRLEKLVAENFKKCSLINIQCKTNWNDNAQIPMMWNLIFQQAISNTHAPQGFLVGKNSFHLRNLGYFAYSFITVPSGGVEKIKPTSMQVLRVKTLTGGAYWGRKTSRGISRSISEFFSHQYSASVELNPNVNVIGCGYVAALKSATPDIDISTFLIN